MRLRTGSREYLSVPITAPVELDAQTVEIGLQAIASPRTAADWYTAAWTGDPGTTRTAQILVGPGSSPSVGEIPAGVYSVLYRVTDTPEIPEERAYILVMEDSGE